MKLKLIAILVATLSLYFGLKYVEHLRDSNKTLKQELAQKKEDIKALNLAVDELNSQYQRLNEIMAAREFESNALRFNIDSIKKGVRDEKKDGFIEFNLFNELNSRVQ